MTCGFEQLRDDLGISFAIEPNTVKSGTGTNVFTHSRHNGSATCASSQQNGAVDIEENQLGGHSGNIRLRAVHLSSSLRTATSRGRSVAARVPGSHGSMSVPPQARVE
jgi:hypothetical protein